MYLCLLILCFISDQCYSSDRKEYKYFPLVQDRAFINGEWVEADSRLMFSVFNPCNVSEIAAVPDMEVKDVTEAIDAASAAFGNWSKAAPQERAGLLRRWLELLQQNAAETAEVVSLETGKPLQEAVAEVTYGNSFVDMFASETTRLLGETLTSSDNSKQLVYLRQPIGVVAIITPWNFPYALLLRKVAAALAAGCCCVVKPAEDAPLSALAVASTLQQAGSSPPEEGIRFQIPKRRETCFLLIRDGKCPQKSN